MSYEYMTGMGQSSGKSFFDMRRKAEQSSSTSTSAPPAPSGVINTGGSSTTKTSISPLFSSLTKATLTIPDLIVPSTVPKTGIMKVFKGGKKYFVVTEKTRKAKIAALNSLGTSQGMGLAAALSSQQLARCQNLDGTIMPSSEVEAYAGKHALAFCGGSAYTESFWNQVQEVLMPAARVMVSPFSSMTPAQQNGSSTQTPTTDRPLPPTVDEAEENVNQAKDISAQAEQQVTQYIDEINRLEEALINAQSSSGGSSAEVQELQAQLFALTEQLRNAQATAEDAANDLEDAEEDFEAVAPWYRRYMWHMGVGVLLLAAAGGGYWWWSSRSEKVTSNTRLPEPKSPKHPAGF